MGDVEETDIELKDEGKGQPDGSSMTLFGTQDPDEVMKKAEKTAQPLADAIEDRDLISNIQGNQHVEIEGWTMLGSMLGVFPVTEWTEHVQYGNAEGFEARVNAVTRQGEVVGSAEAMCLNDEPNWKNATMQELRSMAQTRASSKALRMPLGFIVQLAGYEATPAEEMDNVEKRKSGSNNDDHSTDPDEVTAPPFMDGIDEGDPISELNDGGLEFLKNDYLTGDKLEGDYADENKAMLEAVKTELKRRSDDHADNEPSPRDEIRTEIMELGEEIDWSVIDVDEWEALIKTTAETYSEGDTVDMTTYEDIRDYLRAVNEGEKELQLDDGGILPIIPF